MKTVRKNMINVMMIAMLCLGVAAFAQEKADTNLMKIATGQKATVAGVIVKRNADSLVVQNSSGQNVQVNLSAATVIKEKKKNIFRGAKSYAPAQLVRGLPVEVEGLGDANGALAARDIKFTQTEAMVANSVESRVTPVEGRLTETEGRLTASEENARHLSGQVEEVREVANTARGNAKTAQESADSANAGVNEAKEQIVTVDKTTNARITAVDDFQVKDTAAVRFKLNSAVLSPEAKEQLDNLVKEALAQRGYVVEVTGFASADGDAAFNRELSQHRADAVVQYLADNLIPLRRIVTPFGFGTKMPVADNKTPAGRAENRRVEVKILVSKGLASSETQSAAVGKEQK